MKKIFKGQTELIKLKRGLCRPNLKLHPRAITVTYSIRIAMSVLTDKMLTRMAMHVLTDKKLTRMALHVLTDKKLT